MRLLFLPDSFFCIGIMTAGIVAMILFLTLMILFVRPNDARELGRREQARALANRDANRRALEASHQNVLDELVARFEESVYLNLDKHTLRLTGHPLALTIHIVATRPESTTLRLVVEVPEHTPLHESIDLGHIDEVWRHIGLEALFASTERVTLQHHGFIGHDLAVVIEISRPFTAIAPLCHAMRRHLSIETEAWPDAHRARVKLRDEAWHAASASMTYLIEEKGERPVYLERYNDHALLVVLEYMQRTRKDGWFVKAQLNQRVCAALLGTHVEPLAKLALLDFMSTHHARDVFWDHDAIQAQICALVCTYPEHPVSLMMVLEQRGTHQGQLLMLLAILEHLCTCQDAMTRLHQLLAMDWPPYSKEDLEEAQTLYDEQSHGLALGILCPDTPEFVERTRTWLESEPGWGTALFMWQEIVHDRRDLLGAHSDFVGMLVQLIARRRGEAAWLVEVLLPDFATAPTLVEHLRAHMSTTRPHTTQGWEVLGKHVLEHVPLDDDAACMYMFELAMHCPHEQEQKAFFRGIDPEDTRYMAFQILRELDVLTRRIDLAQKLAELDVLPEHAADALLHMVAHDKRSSIYGPLLTRLGQSHSGHVLVGLERLATQRAHSRTKREHIRIEIARIRERLDVHGGELSLSDHSDDLRGGLSKSAH